MASVEIPTQDIRAQQWVRAMTARPAGLKLDKAKMDTNLWNLLSGGKRNAPSQPIAQIPVQPSPRKFKQQLQETCESDPWQTESSSTYVYYVTGDLALRPETPTALEQAELALQAEKVALAAAVRQKELDEKAKAAAEVPETDNTQTKIVKKRRKKKVTKPKPVFKPTDSEKKQQRIAKRNGMGYIRRKKKKNTTKPKVIPPRPTFFPYGMNNIDDRLTHNVKTAYKKGIYKTAIAAEKLIANRKNQSPQNGKKATLKEQNAIQKNEVRRAYNDLIRSTVGGNNNSNNKSEVDLKKLRKQMKYMKHPPLPLPTPSKAGFCPRMISNPPPQPNIGISNLLRWPGEEGPPMPKKSIKHGVVETLMNENAVGWDELPAAGMSSGVKLNQRSNILSPEKSILKTYERTAPPKNQPRAPTPLDPKEEEVREALNTMPVKVVAFKEGNFGDGSNPKKFGHLPPQWTKFIPPAGYTRKKKEAGVGDLLRSP